MTTTRAPAPTFDESTVPAGTTVRFFLLAVLLAVASAAMMLDFLADGLRGNDFGCALAAGSDPNRLSGQFFSAIAAQQDAFDACRERSGAPRRHPWWMVIAWPTVIVIASAAVFLGLSRWTIRRHRLRSVDRAGELGRTLSELVVIAGLKREPEFVIDPMAHSASAKVFGRTRAPVVCVHEGLTRSTDPVFRAVVLHELAHIRFGDVTRYYLTIALWRVFLLLALLPYAAWNAKRLAEEHIWDSDLPYLMRNLLLCGFLVVLVYLARSEVLRNREIYADRAAVGWGADAQVWYRLRRPSPVAGRVHRTRTAVLKQRAVAAFSELWRTHPRWDLRGDALTDPAPLFQLSGLPMFLTGSAAAIINAYWRDLTYYPVSRFGPIIAAGLIAAVAGTMIARAVVYAVRNSAPAPAILVPGLWLGVGFLSGELFTNRVALGTWLPDQPAVLLAVPLLGVPFGWWVAQTTALWPYGSADRSLRLVLPATVLAAWLALAPWLEWWTFHGDMLANGVPYSLDAVYATMTRREDQVSGHGLEKSATAIVWWSLVTVKHTLLGPVALVVITAFPLLAGFFRDRTASPTALRGTLLPALAGGVAGWIGVVGVQMYLHTWRPPLSQRLDSYLAIYLTWIMLALLLAALVAAVAAQSRPYAQPFLRASTAAPAAMAIAGLGALVLMSADGCLAPLNTLVSVCGWRPAFIATPWLMLDAAALIGVATAAVVSAAAEAIRWIHSKATDSVDITDSTPKPQGTRTDRLWIAVLSLLVTALIVVPFLPTIGPDYEKFKPWRGSYLQSAAAQPISRKTQANQVAAWMNYGGLDLLDRLNVFRVNLEATLRVPAGISPVQLGSVCADLSGIARDADAYFRIPEPRAHTAWRKLITDAHSGSETCISATHVLDQPAGIISTDQTQAANEQLLRSFDHITECLELDTQIVDWIAQLLGISSPPP